jgi:hypothetical protein
MDGEAELRPGGLVLTCLLAVLAATAGSASGGMDLATASEVHYLPPTKVRVGPHAAARHERAGLVVECRIGEPGEISAAD